VAATSFVRDAVKYAQACVGKRQAVSHHAQLACKRFLDDLETGGYWEFREDLAEKAMIFASMLPNIKGPDAGRDIELMDWQRFVFANVFGFVERGTTTRRFRQAAIFVPKGNGKTTIAAPVALYVTFGEGEGGAEGYAAAVTRDQARILFDTAQHMSRRSEGMRRELGIAVQVNAIYQQATASRFIPISSDAKALDGLNVAIAVCDEIGSHRTSEVYDALITAMGKRRQPLLLAISTATGNNAGIGKTLWDYGLRILSKSQEDDRFFAAIYSIDDEDDPWDEATWVKANPGWGRSVQPDAIRAIMRQARNNPAQEAAARTRHLNVWIGADEALFSMRSWIACGDRSLQLDDFMGRRCHMALDLASKTDLASVAIVFPEYRDSELTYSVFTRNYTNEGAVMEARNASYPGWAADGELIITPGDETDYATIEADILDLCRRFRVESLGYDPWGSTQMAQRLQGERVNCVEFRATTANFSEATKELDAAMRSGRVRHDGNGVLTWCIGNVVGHYDARSNVYPRKARPENKIDAATATIMAIARCMTEPGPSVYQTRGLLTI
jgi:phage terminase large subunit-like protein